MTPLTLKQKARRRGRIFDFDPLTPQEIQQWEKEKEKLPIFVILKENSQYG